MEDGNQSENVASSDNGSSADEDLRSSRIVKVGCAGRNNDIGGRLSKMVLLRKNHFDIMNKQGSQSRMEESYL